MDQKEIDDLIRTFETDWGFLDSVVNAAFDQDLRALIDKITTPPKSCPRLEFSTRRKIVLP
jgi:hypothetical protein